MDNVKNIKRDYFGLEDKSLFEREYNYIYNGETPLNAVIVDMLGNCYMSGKYIGNGLTFGGKCRVWFNDGNSQIMNLKTIEPLSEDKLNKIPKENFVFKVENSTYIPNKDCMHFSPYDKKSKGICFKYIYDKSLLIELIFVPSDFYKYFGNVIQVKSRKEVYKDVYKAYSNAENNFDRTLLSLMLQKLEKSDKYYASIERSISETEYEFVKNLYEEKNIDWITKAKQVYGLFKLVSMYGLDDLQTIKDNYGKRQNVSETVKELKELKKNISFPGTCTEPDTIIAPTHIHCFYSDEELNSIKVKLNNMITIENNHEFLSSMSLFDSKMIKKENFTEFMNQILNKSTFLEENKKNMMRDLLELQDFIKLMHTIYGDEFYNTSILDGKVGNVNTRLHWLLNNDKKELKDIKYFKVNDYENKKTSYEDRYLEKILSAFNTEKERRENSKSSNLEIYKKLIACFEEEFTEVKDGIISFNFESNLLNKIFDYVKTNKYLLLDILKGETFGHIDKKEYFPKLKVENAIYDIIKTYNI